MITRTSQEKTTDIIIIYALIIFAVLNATLRFSDNGMTSLYRILSPLPFLFYSIKYLSRIYKTIIFSIVFMLYSIVVSLMYYNYVYWEYYVFFLYLVVLFVFVRVLSFESGFKSTFFKFLDCLTMISIVLCLIQYFVRIPYPFLKLPAKNGMNIFMSNENEIAEPMGCMLLIYFYRMLFLRKNHLIKMALIILIIMVNDAKLTLFGCVFGMFLLILFWIAKKISRGNAFRYQTNLIVIVFTIIVAIAMLYFINPTLKFRDYDISVQELVFSPINKILTLSTFDGLGGSMIDRTNAIIFGLRELINSKFLGIGLGNSVTMLAMPQYELLTAKSMHNFFFQTICEFGILGIILWGSAVIWGLRKIPNSYKDSSIILKISFGVAFILISSQSSIGIMSNYYTWIVVFYILLMPSQNTSKEKLLYNSEYIHKSQKLAIQSA